MANPMEMYIWFHDAILRELAGVEDAARNLNREKSDEIEEFGEHISWFHSVTKEHERAEETILFPALERRYTKVAASYEFDHDYFEPNYFGEINACVEALSRAHDNDERIAQATRIHRQSVALNEVMRLHITKENELLLPVIGSEFNVDEQIDIATRMGALFDPKLMGEVSVWMYRGQNGSDRENFLRFLIRALPDEAFGKLAGVLSGIGPATEWASFESRIPELRRN